MSFNLSLQQSRFQQTIGTVQLRLLPATSPLRHDIFQRSRTLSIALQDIWKTPSSAKKLPHYKERTSACGTPASHILMNARPDPTSFRSKYSYSGVAFPDPMPSNLKAALEYLATVEHRLSDRSDIFILFYETLKDYQAKVYVVSFCAG